MVLVSMAETESTAGFAMQTVLRSGVNVIQPGSRRSTGCYAAGFLGAGMYFMTLRSGREYTRTPLDLLLTIDSVLSSGETEVPWVG
jgi:hypothetical protein